MEPRSPQECGLPHREPFVFIDAVVAIEPGQSATCRKFFAASEPFFRGHFPGNPLVPGVILAEAAAQTAGIAAGEPGRIYHLSAIRQMKFIKPVGPDSLVEFTATKTGGMGGLLQFQVTAAVNGAVSAEGIIILAAASG
ncbi:MAG TPA: 3-hydroxyacyl-ACP dehydratase FabZ family protein [Chthoniobacteraceae bacterium]|jgi:3-hydroxyacyl-[acyl-carrier-protein] dehydratase|nr:3-hydroxyacyl-ACP dehydratase FabZ family protein [Chthoniobacteraceae bacterium]